MTAGVAAVDCTTVVVARRRRARRAHPTATSAPTRPPASAATQDLAQGSRRPAPGGRAGAGGSGRRRVGHGSSGRSCGRSSVAGTTTALAQRRGPAGEYRRRRRWACVRPQRWTRVLRRHRVAGIVLEILTGTPVTTLSGYGNRNPSRPLNWSDAREPLHPTHWGANDGRPEPSPRPQRAGMDAPGAVPLAGARRSSSRPTASGSTRPARSARSARCSRVPRVRAHVPHRPRRVGRSVRARASPHPAPAPPHRIALVAPVATALRSASQLRSSGGGRRSRPPAHDRAALQLRGG